MSKPAIIEATGARVVKLEPLHSHSATAEWEVVGWNPAWKIWCAWCMLAADYWCDCEPSQEKLKILLNGLESKRRIDHAECRALAHGGERLRSSSRSRPALAQAGL